MTVVSSTAQPTKSTAQKRSSSKETVVNTALFSGTSANLPVGANSSATASADFNGDGIPDLAITLSSAAVQNNLVVFLGSGNGSFGSAQQFTSNGQTAVSVVTGDFNQDGNSDIATTNFGSDTVSLLLGEGNGNFRSAQTFRVGSQPNALATGDFNQDGRLDLVTANAGENTNTLSVLLGNGQGGFESAKALNVAGTQPFSVATGDFDRDGNLDVVSADSLSASLSVLFGKGNGEFKTAKQFFVGGATPVTVVTGDFDEDNKLDIVTGNLGTGGRNISVLFGDGKGDFPEGAAIAAGGGVSSLVSGDFNGDGHLDLAGTLYNSPNLTILFGDGEGNFSRSGTPVVNNVPSGIATADFNRDGKPDLITASGGSNNASVLLNKTSFVVLRSSKSSGEVDGSQEKSSSMTVNLDLGTLVVDSPNKVQVAVNGFDDVLGTQVKDKITGSNQVNLLNGNAGQDQILGLNGNDTLLGGDGKDRLEGGDGKDKLTGGIANDQLTGDAGADRFIFDYGKPFSLSDGQDRITDFEKGADKIVLDRSTFTALTNKVQFQSVQQLSNAQTSTALITYIRSTGRLYYNQNGAAAGFGTGGWFATLDGSKSANGNLTAADFLTQK